ncbi:MAG: universal stress protein [Gloeocapsa sp. DLM2.Bin57]|nr:MAG: universal stress protein [Gloeocapsa sp. DLM2.Bin57]
MYKKILVSIDLSAINTQVLARGLSLAKAYQADVMLLHVLSPEDEDSPLAIPPNLTEIYPAVGNDYTMETWRQQWQEFEQKGLKTLQNLAQEATSSGVKVEYQQVPGIPGRTICRVAEKWQADLILIGRRGRTALMELFLGSVSNYVVHHAQCCVLIVQHKD